MAEALIADQPGDPVTDLVSRLLEKPLLPPDLWRRHLLTLPDALTAQSELTTYFSAVGAEADGKGYYVAAPSSELYDWERNRHAKPKTTPTVARGRREVGERITRPGDQDAS